MEWFERHAEKSITYLIPDDRYNCIIHYDLVLLIRSPRISIANQSMASAIIPNSRIQ